MHTENTGAKQDALMSELNAIRAQIRSIDYPDPRMDERDALRRLTEKHNRLVEDMHLLDEKPRFDPIDHLPEEVWLDVLKQAVTRESYGSSFISTDMVLFLTSVSLRWRHFIESTPSLWSDIVLDDEQEDLAMKLMISMSLSRDAYLTVQFISPMCCWNGVQSIVLPHKERIRGIYLVGGGDDNCFENFFFFTIPQLSTPQLRCIDWIQYSYIDGLERKIFLSNQSRHIRSISGDCLNRDIFNLPTIRNLRELTTEEDAKRVLEISEAMPRLKKVEFLASHLTDKNSVGRPLTTTPLNWTSLTYDQGVIETVNLLLIRLPLLLDLKLTIPCDDLRELMSSLQCLKALRNLELRPSAFPNSDFVPPVVLFPLITVQHFTFRVCQILDKDQSRKLSPVSDCLFSLIPDVEVLKIDSSMNPIGYELSSAVGFRKAHTLHLNLLDLLRLRPVCDLKLSQSVRNLTVDFNGPVNFIAPGVENVRVIKLDLHMAGDQWSTVQKLHFSHFNNASNDFQSLTSLYSLIVDGDEAVTRFCVIIATSPDTCPALHTLSFGRFPDLDILFIMLERRNLGSYPARARIRKLELPTRIPLSNFKVIRDLLRGRMVERQSNFEASVQSNIDIFLDRDIPGCISCHKAQAFCGTRTCFPWGGFRPMLPPPLPPYPATVEEILDTWEARSFTDLIRGVRGPTCRERGDLTQITDDSLELQLTEWETDMASSASQ